MSQDAEYDRMLAGQLYITEKKSTPNIASGR